MMLYRVIPAIELSIYKCLCQLLTIAFSISLIQIKLKISKFDKDHELSNVGWIEAVLYQLKIVRLECFWFQRTEDKKDAITENVEDYHQGKNTFAMPLKNNALVKHTIVMWLKININKRNGTNSK